jgi:glycosyltransferase involved in cell wall biosynthesis
MTAITPAPSDPVPDPIRLCVVCTHSLTLATLYKGLFPYLAARGFDIDVIVGDTEYTEFAPEDFGPIRPIVIPMVRLPSPAADFRSLLGFVGHFSRHRYDVVHVSTPKASLTVTLARAMTGGGPVVFVYRRCVYELMTGLKRTAYLNVDRLICALSTLVVPISRQLERFLVDERVAPRAKVRLIGAGSSNGVDTDHFDLTPQAEQAAEALRQELGIPADAPVLLFLGRVCSEKGVDLLRPVFDQVRAAIPGVHMVVAGPDDDRDPIAAETAAFFAADPAIHRIGFVSDTAPLYALSSVFVFPSYFEGFGNVLLEAAAMQRVSVAFDVPGVSEAVQDGVSGRLVASGDAPAMSHAVIDLLQNPAERTAMQDRARTRVVELFSRTRILAEIETMLRGLARRR